MLPILRSFNVAECRGGRGSGLPPILRGVARDRGLLYRSHGGACAALRTTDSEPPRSLPPTLRKPPSDPFLKKL
jgi:hypothetical protein